MPVIATAAESPPLAVSLRGVGRAFPAPDPRRPPRRVLAGVDLDIPAGEILAVLGASGGGKSTLLRLIAGLDTPDAGEVRIDGRPVLPQDQRCAVAFQEPRLLPWRSVRRNVGFGLPRGLGSESGRARVDRLIDLVGLDHAAQLRPRQISGGMAQRVSLARALARGPGVLVLDEPFGALDALTRLTMHRLLLDIHRVEPATIVLVTHDVDEALALADRVILLGVDPDRPEAGSGIRRVVDVPGERPRDRADTALETIRTRLLAELGVPTSL